MSELAATDADQQVPKAAFVEHGVNDPAFWWMRVRVLMSWIDSSSTARLSHEMQELFEELRAAPYEFEQRVREEMVPLMREDPVFCELFEQLWDSVTTGRRIAVEAEDRRILDLMAGVERFMETRFHARLICPLLRVPEMRERAQ